MDLGSAPAVGLSLSTRTADGVAIAELSGELEITSSPALRDQLLGVLQRSNRLVIDLSGVTCCDASGLAVLVGARRRAALLGGWARLAGVPPQVDDVLRRTGLYPHLDVFLTAQGAAVGASDEQCGPFDAAASDSAGRSVAQPMSGRPRLTGPPKALMISAG